MSFPEIYTQLIGSGKQVQIAVKQLLIELNTEYNWNPERSNRYLSSLVKNNSTMPSFRILTLIDSDPQLDWYNNLVTQNLQDFNNTLSNSSSHPSKSLESISLNLFQILTLYDQITFRLNKLRKQLISLQSWIFQLDDKTLQQCIDINGSKWLETLFIPLVQCQPDQFSVSLDSSSQMYFQSLASQHIADFANKYTIKLLPRPLGTTIFHSTRDLSQFKIEQHLANPSRLTPQHIEFYTSQSRILPWDLLHGFFLKPDVQLSFDSIAKLWVDQLFLLKKTWKNDTTKRPLSFSIATLMISVIFSIFAKILSNDPTTDPSKHSFYLITQKFRFLMPEGAKATETYGIYLAIWEFCFHPFLVPSLELDLPEIFLSKATIFSKTLVPNSKKSIRAYSRVTHHFEEFIGSLLSVTPNILGDVFLLTVVSHRPGYLKPSIDKITSNYISKSRKNQEPSSSSSSLASSITIPPGPRLGSKPLSLVVIAPLYRASKQNTNYPLFKTLIQNLFWVYGENISSETIPKPVLSSALLGKIFSPLVCRLWGQAYNSIQKLSFQPVFAPNTKISSLFSLFPEIKSASEAYFVASKYIFASNLFGCVFFERKLLNDITYDERFFTKPPSLASIVSYVSRNTHDLTLGQGNSSVAIFCTFCPQTSEFQELTSWICLRVPDTLYQLEIENFKFKISWLKFLPSKADLESNSLVDVLSNNWCTQTLGIINILTSYTAYHAQHFEDSLIDPKIIPHFEDEIEANKWYSDFSTACLQFLLPIKSFPRLLLIRCTKHSNSWVRFIGHVLISRICSLAHSVVSLLKSSHLYHLSANMSMILSDSILPDTFLIFPKLYFRLNQMVKEKSKSKESQSIKGHDSSNVVSNDLSNDSSKEANIPVSGIPQLTEQQKKQNMQHMKALIECCSALVEFSPQVDSTKLFGLIMKIWDEKFVHNVLPCFAGFQVTAYSSISKSPGVWLNYLKIFVQWYSIHPCEFLNQFCMCIFQDICSSLVQKIPSHMTHLKRLLPLFSKQLLVVLSQLDSKEFDWFLAQSRIARTKSWELIDNVISQNVEPQYIQLFLVLFSQLSKDVDSSPSNKNHPWFKIASWILVYCSVTPKLLRICVSVFGIDNFEFWINRISDNPKISSFARKVFEWNWRFTFPSENNKELQLNPPNSHYEHSDYHHFITHFSHFRQQSLGSDSLIQLVKRQPSTFSDQTLDPTTYSFLLHSLQGNIVQFSSPKSTIQLLKTRSDLFESCIDYFINFSPHSDAINDLVLHSSISFPRKIVSQWIFQFCVAHPDVPVAFQLVKKCSFWIESLEFHQIFQLLYTICRHLSKSKIVSIYHCIHSWSRGFSDSSKEKVFYYYSKMVLGEFLNFQFVPHLYKVLFNSQGWNLLNWSIMYQNYQPKLLEQITTQLTNHFTDDDILDFNRSNSRFLRSLSFALFSGVSPQFISKNLFKKFLSQLLLIESMIAHPDFEPSFLFEKMYFVHIAAVCSNLDQSFLLECAPIFSKLAQIMLKVSYPHQKSSVSLIQPIPSYGDFVPFIHFLPLSPKSVPSKSTKTEKSMITTPDSDDSLIRGGALSSIKISKNGQNLYLTLNEMFFVLVYTFYALIQSTDDHKSVDENLSSAGTPTSDFPSDFSSSSSSSDDSDDDIEQLSNNQPQTSSLHQIIFQNELIEELLLHQSFQSNWKNVIISELLLFSNTQRLPNCISTPYRKFKSKVSNTTIAFSSILECFCINGPWLIPVQTQTIQNSITIVPQSTLFTPTILKYLQIQLLVFHKHLYQIEIEYLGIVEEYNSKIQSAINTIPSLASRRFIPVSYSPRIPPLPESIPEQFEDLESSFSLFQFCSTGLFSWCITLFSHSDRATRAAAYKIFAHVYLLLSSTFRDSDPFQGSDLSDQKTNRFHTIRTDHQDSSQEDYHQDYDDRDWDTNENSPSNYSNSGDYDQYESHKDDFNTNANTNASTSSSSSKWFYDARLHQLAGVVYPQPPKLGRFNQQMMIFSIVNCLKNSISSKNELIPSISTQFFSQALTLCFNPDHSCYRIVINWFAKNSRLRTKQVPFFLKAFFTGLRGPPLSIQMKRLKTTSIHSSWLKKATLSDANNRMYFTQHVRHFALGLILSIHTRNDLKKIQSAHIPKTLLDFLYSGIYQLLNHSSSKITSLFSFPTLYLAIACFYNILNMDSVQDDVELRLGFSSWAYSVISQVFQLNSSKNPKSLFFQSKSDIYKKKIPVPSKPVPLPTTHFPINENDPYPHSAVNFYHLILFMANIPFSSAPSLSNSTPTTTLYSLSNSKLEKVFKKYFGMFSSNTLPFSIPPFNEKFLFSMCIVRMAFHGILRVSPGLVSTFSNSDKIIKLFLESIESDTSSNDHNWLKQFLTMD